jgi:iron-sulfur cluster repair protein YtfE (RIC family)
VKRDPSLVPLSHQHQHGLGLAVLIDRNSLPANQLRDKALLMWRNELEGHFKVEETLLFPQMRDSVVAAGFIDELIGDHRKIAALISELADASDESLPNVLNQLGALLSAHIRAEERQLFERIQAELTPEELAALGGRIEAEIVRVCPLLTD